MNSILFVISGDLSIEKHFISYLGRWQELSFLPNNPIESALIGCSRNHHRIGVEALLSFVSYLYAFLLALPVSVSVLGSSSPVEVAPALYAALPSVELLITALSQIVY